MSLRVRLLALTLLAGATGGCPSCEPVAVPCTSSAQCLSPEVCVAGQCRAGPAPSAVRPPEPVPVTTVFSDDFEQTGRMITDTPPGPWTGKDLPEPRNFLGRAPEAAHRGEAGLLFVDTVNERDGGGQNGLIGALTLGSSASVRVWLRVAESNDLGGPFPIQLASAGQQVAELRILNPGTVPEFVCWDGSLDLTQRVDGLASGRWYLVELVTEGLGTPAGRCRFFLDGAPAGAVEGLDWTGVAVRQLELGSGWAVKDFVGRLHYDELRVTDLPAASRVVAHLPASPAIGDCAPGWIGAESSTGIPRPFPAGSQLSVAIDGGVRLFAGEGCNGQPLSSFEASGPIAVSVLGVASGSARLELGADDLVGTVVELQVR